MAEGILNCHVSDAHLLSRVTYHSLNVVTPAHKCGATSAGSMSFGMLASASDLKVAYSAYPPSLPTP